MNLYIIERKIVSLYLYLRAFQHNLKQTYSVSYLGLFTEVNSMKLIRIALLPPSLVLCSIGIDFGILRISISFLKYNSGL